LESVDIAFYKPGIQEFCYSESELEQLFITFPSVPKQELLESLRNGLMKVCPFKKEI
jgi:hypothetical protein